MRDEFIWGKLIADLQERWCWPGDPGGLGHLDNILRDHLTDLDKWRVDALYREGVDSELPEQEVAKRVRESADVLRQLAEYLEDCSRGRQECQAASVASARRSVQGGRERGSSIGTAGETNKGLN